MRQFEAYYTLRNCMIQKEEQCGFALFYVIGYYCLEDETFKPSFLILR